MSLPPGYHWVRSPGTVRLFRRNKLMWSTELLKVEQHKSASPPYASVTYTSNPVLRKHWRSSEGIETLDGFQAWIEALVMTGLLDLKELEAEL